MLRESLVFGSYFVIPIFLLLRKELSVIILLGINVCKCFAMEHVSEGCIVSIRDKVIEVKLTYILFFSEKLSPILIDI